MSCLVQLALPSHTEPIENELQQVDLMLVHLGVGGGFMQYIAHPFEPGIPHSKSSHMKPIAGGIAYSRNRAAGRLTWLPLNPAAVCGQPMGGA